MTVYGAELSRDELLSIVAVLTVVIDLSKETEDKMTETEKKERDVCIGARDKLWTMLTFGQETEYVQEKKS